MPDPAAGPWARFTLARPAPTIRGLGLFTGEPGAVTILPARAGEWGVRFRRVDLPGRPEIPAVAGSLGPPPGRIPGRNTTLRAGERAAAITVEHILSALAGCGVTDATVELEGDEVPIADGSAAVFGAAIGQAGLEAREGGPGPMVIRRPVEVRSGEATITARPGSGEGCLYRYELDYGPASPIAPQAAEVRIVPGGGPEYATGVAPARTFCLKEEAEAMRAAGLFGHLSPREMLVIGPQGPVENAYRLESEPARHKLLDLIGDLMLAGGPMRGEIVARRAGHALNHEMARALGRLLD
jgi:UDP-3-O-acyl-N-acetylglucosamine deacetylase